MHDDLYIYKHMDFYNTINKPPPADLKSARGWFVVMGRKEKRLWVKEY